MTAVSGKLSAGQNSPPNPVSNSLTRYLPWSVVWMVLDVTVDMGCPVRGESVGPGGRGAYAW
jgi:hypothetical protein